MELFTVIVRKDLIENGQSLIKNGVVQPLKDYGLNSNWTNNNAESINHVLKQGTDWKKKTLLQLIAILKTPSKLQNCIMKGVLFGIGDFASAKSRRGYGISQNIWNNMTPKTQHRKLIHFWLHGQGAVAKVLQSSDGKLRKKKKKAEKECKSFIGEKKGQKFRPRSNRTKFLPKVNLATNASQSFLSQSSVQQPFVSKKTSAFCKPLTKRKMEEISNIQSPLKIKSIKKTKFIKSFGDIVG